MWNAASFRLRAEIRSDPWWYENENKRPSSSTVLLHSTEIRSTLFETMKELFLHTLLQKIMCSFETIFSEAIGDALWKQRIFGLPIHFWHDSSLFLSLQQTKISSEAPNSNRAPQTAQFSSLDPSAVRSYELNPGINYTPTFVRSWRERSSY